MWRGCWGAVGQVGGPGSLVHRVELAVPPEGWCLACVLRVSLVRGMTQGHMSKGDVKSRKP